MADEIFDFSWKVTESGYKVIRGQPGSPAVRPPDSSKSGLFVSDRIPIGSERTYRKYFPLIQHPDLFLQFASVPPTELAIVVFANRFGLLTENGIFGTDEPSLGIRG